MTDFGIRLKQVMDEKGISASELSRASNVGKNLISYYIHGRCLAKQDKIYMLAKALNVDPGWLMTGVEQQPSQRKFTVFVPSPNFVKITSYMTQDEYEAVVKSFESAYARMKEKGITLND